MCNDAVRIAINEKPRSKFDLIKLAYLHLKRYGLHTHYILSACEIAYTIYKDKKRRVVPFVKKAFIKLGNQAYQLNHLLLRIPTTPRHYVFLVLQGSDYHFSFIDDRSLRRGSVTINDRVACVSFSKEVEVVRPSGYMGIDLNERNVTVSSSDGYANKFSELGEVAEIKQRYRDIRAKIAKSDRGDNRVTSELLSKYGRRERNRTAQRVHRLSKRIVDYAKEHKLGIKVEKLTGIRKLYRKGNRQGRSFRGRMNSWVFGETQRQVDYKAKWDGIPVYFVDPKGTSRNCPDCGSRVTPLLGRKLNCPACDKTWDRDDLASRNVMACVVPQARLSK